MLLSINTSTVQFSMALMEESGALMAEYFMTPASKSVKGFMPTLHDLLTRSSLKADQIEALFVARGPGSFTGLRVGLSAAKGFCQGLDIPIIGVSGLEAMVNQVPQTTHPICPIINSRKGEIFTALFRWGPNGYILRLKQDTCLSIGDLGSIIENKTVFIGNDLPGQGAILKQQLGEKGLLAPANFWNLKASSVGILGLKRLKKGDSDSLSELVPIYIRGADIRLPDVKSK